VSSERRRYVDRTTCRNHRDKVAEFECAGCHQLFCAECVEEIYGENYCEVCQKRLKMSGVVFCSHCISTRVPINSGKVRPANPSRSTPHWYGTCPVCHCQWSVESHWIRASYDCEVARQKRGLLTSVRLFLVRCFLYFMHEVPGPK